MTKEAIEIEVNPLFYPILFEKARYKGIWGGRGSGKSHFGALFGIIKAYTEDVIILFIREKKNTLAGSLKRTVELKIKELGLLDQFKVTNTYIKCLATGSLMNFVGLSETTKESIKSFEGAKYFIIDEAQVISLGAFQYLAPTLRANDAEMLCLWNPKEPDTAVEQYFRSPDHPEDDRIVIKANWDDNIFLNDAINQERLMCKRKFPKLYNHIWEGEFQVISEASVFDDYYTIADFDEPQQPVRFYFGVDFGFSEDPTVLVRCYILDNCLYIDHEQFLYHQDIDRLPALFDKMPKVRNNWIFADNSRPDTISYLKKKGFKIKGAPKGAGSVEDGIEHMKKFDRIYIHKRCPFVQEEFKLYSYEINTATGKPLTKLKDKYNHAIDALRYALHEERVGSVGVLDLYGNPAIHRGKR